MEISTKLAQNIVNSMKDIINQELNFISVAGIIIASTDDERIGQFHKGGKIVIETKKPLIIDNNDKYSGSKKGINVPVYLENVIIGVIGITGEASEVSKYVEILKRMTEILIKDAYLKDLSFKKIENHRLIIENLLFREFSTNFYNGESNLFDFPINVPHRVVVGKIENNNREIDKTSMYKLISNHFVDHTKNVFLVDNSRIIILFDTAREDALDKILQQIIDQAFQQHNLKLTFAVGCICNTIHSFKQSYVQAQEALDWSKMFSNNTIEYYEKLDLGLLLIQVASHNLDSYLNKVLINLKPNEVEEYQEILEIYEKNNGSITQSADDLFIHKNTLQYKLNKLSKLTDYNPRNLKDYVILKLAFMLHRIHNRKQLSFNENK